jgi:hypothetical protein
MNSTSKLDQELAKLGISELKSVEHVRTLQKDMLRLLRRSKADPISYAGLEYCGPQHCRRTGCSEACAFGARQRRRAETPKIIHLLKQRGGPLRRVRVCRPHWSRPFGELKKVSIAWGKDLAHRALDSLFDNTIIAVGTFKVAPIGIDTGHWLCEIDLIVAGRDETDLQNAFSAVRAGKIPDVRVTKIDDLNTVINEVTSANLPRRHPQLLSGPPLLAHRKEFFSWLLNMKVGARLVRYGCDSHFNPLDKRKRTRKPKIRKGRRYPVWLVPFMFGYGERWRDNDPSKYGFKPLPR